MATALRRYYRGHNLVTLREVPTAQSRVYHFDHQGTTQCLTDSTGTITDRFASDAWGAPVKRTGSSLNRHWYVGNWGYYHRGRASEVEYYVRARYLAARVGRWCSVDPVDGGLWHYIYADNAPVTYIDPEGKYRTPPPTYRPPSRPPTRTPYRPPVRWPYYDPLYRPGVNPPRQPVFPPYWDRPGLEPTGSVHCSAIGWLNCVIWCAARRKGQGHCRVKNADKPPQFHKEECFCEDECPPKSKRTCATDPVLSRLPTSCADPYNFDPAKEAARNALAGKCVDLHIKTYEKLRGAPLCSGPLGPTTEGQHADICCCQNKLTPPIRWPGNCPIGCRGKGGDNPDVGTIICCDWCQEGDPPARQRGCCRINWHDSYSRL